MAPRVRLYMIGGLLAAAAGQPPAAFSQALAANEVPGANVCVLCDLGAASGDPRWPNEIGQLAAAGGFIYSTTPTGGDNNRGTLFRVSIRTGELEVLHSFGVDERGANPRSGLVAVDDPSADGGTLLYGTTYSAGHIVVAANGTTRLGGGTVFKYTPGSSKPEILHTFRNGSLAGIEPEICEPGKPCRYSPQQRLNAAPAYPMSAPVRALDGKFYGVAMFTGNQAFGALYVVESYKGQSGITTLCLGGTVPTNPDISDADLRDRCLFNIANGNRPASLVADPEQNVLYGVTVGGATGNRYGTVFSASLGEAAGITVVEKFETLHRFTGGADGATPYSLIVGSRNGLYGTTQTGGTLTNERSGSGVVYRLTPPDDFTPLYTFTGGADGGQPIGGLVEHAGHLYGAARFGGQGRGVLYRVSLGGAFKPLHRFPAQWQATGRTPSTPLLAIGDALYGMTYQGGLNDAGTVFRMTGLEMPHVRQLTAPPRFTTGTLEAKAETPVAGQAQPVLVEVYSDVTAIQENPQTGERIAIDDGIKIRVSNCRNPHVLQFIYRTKQQRDQNGGYLPGIYKTRSGETYPLTTNPSAPDWHTDGGAGKPNAYYDQGGSGQFQNPRIVNPAYGLTIFDWPTFADTVLFPTATGEAWYATATFKDYVICNCEVVGQVRWTRTARFDPAVGQQRDEEYIGISILLPTDPDLTVQQRAELDLDFGWANRQLSTDGYMAVP